MCFHNLKFNSIKICRIISFDKHTTKNQISKEKLKYFAFISERKDFAGVVGGTGVIGGKNNTVHPCRFYV